MSEYNRHPTYGMIGASRWTIGGKGIRLFGSALPGHNAAITLTVHEAASVVDSGTERFTAAGVGACSVR